VVSRNSDRDLTLEIASDSTENTIEAGMRSPLHIPASTTITSR
jgi:hypothetical protein